MLISGHGAGGGRLYTRCYGGDCRAISAVVIPVCLRETAFPAPHAESRTAFSDNGSLADIYREVAS
jgi:hypothetical protein